MGCVSPLLLGGVRFAGMDLVPLLLLLLLLMLLVRMRMPHRMVDETCDTVRQKRVVAKITAFHDVPPGNEKQLQAATVTGPVSVAIEADQRAFQG